MGSHVLQLLALGLLLALPATHPLLRPALGEPSHLLWWIHVLPLALVSNRHGWWGFVPALLLSSLLLITGERLFGAGYGRAAPWETAFSLGGALAFTNALVGGFALKARGVRLELARRAYEDSLTTLPNRRYLMRHVDGRLARVRRGTGPGFGLVYVDLDGFKRINDGLGHHTGDRVIQTAAERLTEAVRDGDLVSRWGGDEFLVTLDPIADDADALRVVDRIREALSSPFDVEENELVITASMGVTMGSAAYSSAGDMVRDADIAMYRAKTRGGDQSCLFDPSMHDAALKRLTLEGLLRRGLQDREFEVQYQPIVALGGGPIRRVEALVRWKRADGTVVPPGEFIDVAETTGLIVPLGRFVLQEAGRWARTWNEGLAADSPVRVSVNVSARQLVQRDFVASVRSAWEGVGARCEWLELEITETLLVEYGPALLTSLHRLRECGVRFAVDDFGTGYSSLQYLDRLPVDTMKIDRSFVTDATSDPRRQKLIRTIVALARELELDTVAEGVETTDSRALVRALGCTYAQGYLFAKAQPAEIIQQMLSLPTPEPGTTGNDRVFTRS